MNAIPRTSTKHGRRLMLSAAAFVAFATTLSADTLNPLSATASSSFSGDQSPNNLINGSGLSGTGTVETRLHDAHGSANTMWHSAGGAVSGTWLEFDLGAEANLDGAYIWQMNQAYLTGRGVRGFTVFVATTATGNIDTEVGTYELPRANGQPGLAAQFVSFGATVPARRVRFLVNSVWSGQTNEYVGLSEVRFSGAVALDFASHPASATDYVGGTHVFRATVIGAPTAYQWFHNDAAINPGGDGPTLVVSNLTLEDAGNYHLVISKDESSATSDTAVLTIENPSAAITNGLALHYPFDETSGTTAADSSANGSNGTLTGYLAGNAMWVPGKVGGALELAPVGTSNARVTTDAGLAVGDAEEFTFTFWLRQQAQVVNNPRIITPVGTEHWALWTPGTGVGFYFPAASPQPQTGVWRHFAVSYNRPAGSYELFVDGVEVVETSSPAYIRNAPTTTQRWTIGGHENLSVTADTLRATIDDLRVYTRRLRPIDVMALYELGAEESLPTLTITRAGDEVTLSWPQEVSGWVLETPPTWQPAAGKMFRASRTTPSPWPSCRPARSSACAKQSRPDTAARPGGMRSPPHRPGSAEPQPGPPTAIRPATLVPDWVG